MTNIQDANESINYYGMRRLYEKTGNQRALDELIINRVTSGELKFNLGYDKDPLIDGAKMSGEAYDKLSNAEKMLLVINGLDYDVPITNIFTKEYLQQVEFSSLVALCENGRISPGELIKFLFDRIEGSQERFKKIECVSEALNSKVNLGGLVLKRISKTLIKIYNEYEASPDDIVSPDFFNVGFMILERWTIPELARRMYNLYVKFGDSQQVLKNCVIKFCNNLINNMKQMSPAEIAEYLYTSDCYRDFIGDNEDFNILLNKIEGDIYELITYGKIPIQFTLTKLYPKFMERNSIARIINEWVKKEEEALLDVYSIWMINGFQETGEDLDNKYLESIKGKGQELPYLMKPVRQEKTS